MLQNVYRVYSSPSQSRYPQLSYFRSNAILNWVQKKLELSYFTSSYAIFSPQLCYFLLFPPQLHYFATPSYAIFFFFPPVTLLSSPS